MTSALSGTIWTAMTMTMKAERPRNPNLATETAARKASATEIATTVRTTIRLLTTSFQKNGRFIASRKFSSVTGDGNHTGVRLRISLPGLSAVVTIQSIGNSITANTRTA